MPVFPGIIAAVTVYALVADPMNIRDQLGPVLMLLPRTGRRPPGEPAHLGGRGQFRGPDHRPGREPARDDLGGRGRHAGDDHGLNIIFGAEESRNFLKRRALSIALTFGGC
jgi:hypothetical protein